MLEAVLVVAGILGGLAVAWHYGAPMRIFNAFWQAWNPRPCPCGGKVPTCPKCGGTGWLTRGNKQ